MPKNVNNCTFFVEKICRICKSLLVSLKKFQRNFVENNCKKIIAVRGKKNIFVNAFKAQSLFYNHQIISQ